MITGTGLYVPSNKVSNEALVASFNKQVNDFNQINAELIEQNKLESYPESSSEFIKKASGIESRYFVESTGILNPNRMRPLIAKRADNDISLQCEMSLQAAHQALNEAQIKGSDIDLVIVSCSNIQRPYPAIAIELQHALGAKGFAFDMNVACSSATFAIDIARNTIRTNSATRALIVNPEVCSGHLDFTDRDSHFIFGDACTAMVVESYECGSQSGFLIESTLLKTDYSNNIRNNNGFLNYAETVDNDLKSLNVEYFKQNGRKVFKEVVPMAVEHILTHLKENQLNPESIKRFWLHQANINMNQLIAKKILGERISEDRIPCILNRFANTGSPGSIIAHHLYKKDFQKNEHGLICSFGAGYSIGSILVKKI